nr:MAG TPA: helix-turn-helix XRE-family like protein [Caudoviricetes sp.]
MCDMDIDYNNEIRFGRLKELLKERRMTVKRLSFMTGIRRDVLSHIITGLTLPKTDVVARICHALRVPASHICVFKGVEEKPYFAKARLMYIPEKEAKGDVTYRPLRRFFEVYFESHPEKTDNDLYDKIATSGKRNGLHNTSGLEKYREERMKARKQECKTGKTVPGIPYATRTKLRQDRPINIRTVYDICKFLGCSIDFVMSYK